MAHVHHRHLRLRDERLQERGDVGLRRHVQAGRRLVKDEDGRPASEGERQRHTLLLAATQLVGEAQKRALGIGQLHGRQQFQLAGRGLRATQPRVASKHFVEVPAYGQRRVQRHPCVLGDVRHLAAPQQAYVGRPHVQQLKVAEGRTAGEDDPARMPIPHGGEGGSALAAAGLACQSEHLTGKELQVDVRDHAQHAAVLLVVADAEVFDDQCGTVGTETRGRAGPGWSRRILR